MNINAKLTSLHSSKKNKDYPALEVTLGKFKKNILLNEIEEYYLKSYLKEEAHADFKKEMNEDADEEISFD